MSGDQISNATSGYQTNQQGNVTSEVEIALSLNGEGAKQYADISRKMVALPEPQNQLAATLDSKVIVAPRFNEAILDGRASITGGFTLDSARSLADQLKFGALPLSFVEQTSIDISPTLGSEQLRYGLIAGLIGLGIVLILALTAATGYFVALEFAYVAVDRNALRQLADDGDAAAQRALHVTSQLSFTLSAAQFGITVTALLVGYVSARSVRRRLSYETWYGIHLYAYLAIALGFLHQLFVGTDDGFEIARADLRLRGVEALFQVSAAGIHGRAAGLHRVCSMAGRKPIRRPLPDITRHVGQAVAIRGIGPAPGRALQRLLRRVAEEGREHLGVLVRLDDVVDPQAVHVRPGAGVERARRHLAGDLRHRVGVLGDRRVVLVDRHVERAPLALGEADPVGRLRGGEHDLAHPQPGRSLEHVVGAEDVRRVRRGVRPEQDGRHRGEVHDGVVGRLFGQVQLVEGRQPGERRVGLTDIGEVDPEVGDGRVVQRDEVGVGDLVALLGEVRRDVPAGLAAATGEEDAHTYFLP